MAKEHKYPKTQSSEMNKVENNVMGSTKKQTTDAGPHLKEGQGTKFQQTTLGQGFLVQNPRPGHAQKGNVEIPKRK